MPLNLNRNIFENMVAVNSNFPISLKFASNLKFVILCIYWNCEHCQFFAIRSCVDVEVFYLFVYFISSFLFHFICFLHFYFFVCFVFWFQWDKLTAQKRKYCYLNYASANISEKKTVIKKLSSGKHNF